MFYFNYETRYSSANPDHKQKQTYGSLDLPTPAQEFKIYLKMIIFVAAKQSQQDLV